MSLPVRGWGLFPNLFPSVAGFCGQAHRALSISPTREREFDVELVGFDLLQPSLACCWRRVNNHAALFLQ